MKRLKLGLILGLIAGVPAGAAIHAQYVSSDAPATQTAALVKAPQQNPTYVIRVNIRFPEPVSMPVRAFVDAGNTVIEFEEPPAENYAPILFIGEGPTTARYTAKGNRYTVDGIITQNAYLVGPSNRPTMSSQVWIEPNFEPRKI